MATTISKLKVDLDFDSSSISQIHLVLFGFQDAVNKILRNHLIRPHWMFAMDNIIRRAVQAAVTILIPELRAHFEPASEAEGVDKDTDEAEEGYLPVAGPGQEPQPHQQHLSLQLGELRQETNRLLEHLVQKEREYQNLLRQTLEQKTQELYHLQLKLKSNRITESPAALHGQRTDKELIDWLQLQGADAKTIEKIIEEGYTLSDILNEITKEDLRYLRLRGGLLCRLWSAVSQYRRAQEASEAKDEA
uniref:MAP3K HisK-N-like globin domain-containing protein n=2 Tax=Callithrix jacchus TaxID=9483 RepID=F7CQ99_CALJA